MKIKILAFLIILLSVTATAGIYLQYRRVTPNVRISLPDKNGSWHQIRTDISPEATVENLSKALEYLFHGVQNKHLEPVFPEGVGYYTLSVKDSIVEINFKAGYLDMPILRRGLCETAMVRTIMTFSGIRKLYLYEEGIPLPIVGRSSNFGLYLDDAHLTFEEGLNHVVREKRTFYFYDERKKKLVAERKEISRYAYESEGKAVLEALRKGTATEGLTTLLTESMQINEVRIRSQVCYVDFGNDFVKEYADMGADKRMMIYSVVNTLADLDNVEYIQFLINGENPEKYAETENIKTLFRKNHVYVD